MQKLAQRVTTPGDLLKEWQAEAFSRLPREWKRAFIADIFEQAEAARKVIRIDAGPCQRSVVDAAARMWEGVIAKALRE